MNINQPGGGVYVNRASKGVSQGGESGGESPAPITTREPISAPGGVVTSNLELPASTGSTKVSDAIGWGGGGGGGVGDGGSTRVAG